MVGRHFAAMVAVVASAAAVTASVAIAACSSSESSRSPVDGGESDSGDVEPVEDSGAPDVVGDTLGAPCSPVKQDCADPNLRCTVIFVNGDYKAACQPPWKPPGGGARADEGAVCNRLQPGADDCVNGTYCIKVGRSIADTACLRHCAKDSDCTVGAKCAVHTTTGPSFGLCWKECTPFSTDCGGGTCAFPHYHIDGVSTFESCRDALASGAAGTTCNQPYDCAADMHCFGMSGFVCTPMCDDTHACDGGTCTPEVGLPNNAGICQ